MKRDIDDFIEKLEEDALKKRGGVPFGKPLDPPPADPPKEAVEEPEEAPEEAEEETRRDPGRKLRERLRRRREKPVPGALDRAHRNGETEVKNRRDRRLRDVD